MCFFGLESSLVVDTKTGVTYLIIRNTFGSGITPLLNADGKHIITNVEEIKKDSWFIIYLLIWRSFQEIYLTL